VTIWLDKSALPLNPDFFTDDLSSGASQFCT
jgi:hypothetical protein